MEKYGKILEHNYTIFRIFPEFWKTYLEFSRIYFEFTENVWNYAGSAKTIRDDAIYYTEINIRT